MAKTITKSDPRVKGVKSSSAARDLPLLCIIVEDLNDNLRPELKHVIEGLSELPVNYRVLVIGDGKGISKFKNTYHVTEDEMEDFLKFAHMALFFTEKPSKKLVKRAVDNDTVPILSSKISFLVDYKAPKEQGSCFKFKELNSWSIYASIVRALENFGFPYDWKNILKAAKAEL